MRTIAHTCATHGCCAVSLPAWQCHRSRSNRPALWPRQQASLTAWASANPPSTAKPLTACVRRRLGGQPGAAAGREPYRVGGSAAAALAAGRRRPRRRILCAAGKGAREAGMTKLRKRHCERLWIVHQLCKRVSCRSDP